ncbi:hypothetical protein Tco_0379588 [Tanacetum coccineum]
MPFVEPALPIPLTTEPATSDERHRASVDSVENREMLESNIIKKKDSVLITKKSILGIPKNSKQPLVLKTWSRPWKEPVPLILAAGSIRQWHRQNQATWDSKVQYDTTTDMSAHYYKTTFTSNEQIKVLGKQTAYTSQSVQHQLGLGHPNTFHYTYSDESDKDEPSEAEKSMTNLLIREPSNTFLMRDAEIILNPLEDSDELDPILRVSEKPLESLDYISDTFNMTITNPLFDFDYEFTSNSDNPIFDI